MRVVGTLALQSSDTTAPSQPQLVQATAVNRQRIDLSWTASTDNIGVTGYQIFRNGAPLDTTDETAYSDTTVSANTTYTYVVVAYDAAGNNSQASAQSQATTPPNASPSWQSIATQTLIVGNSYTLNLNSVCSDADADTIQYSIPSGTLPTGLALVGAIISGTPSVAGQTPTITVRAFDGFVNVDTTIAYSTKTADVTAPPVPAGLSATAVSSSQIDVSWSASTDAAGTANEFVSGTQDYRVYRSLDGTNFALRTTTASTGYSDTGLSSNTQHHYKVAARDATLNESAQSGSVSATTTSASLLQDWLNRSTTSNVVMATRYTNLAQHITPWMHPTSLAAQCVINPTGGILGDGCLRNVIPKTNDQSVANWRRPLDDSWTSDSQGFGSDFFTIQFRFRVGPMLITDQATNGTALKICNLARYAFAGDHSSSRSNTEFETVVYIPHVSTVGGQANVNAYRRNDAGAGGGLAGGGNDIEGAYDMWHNDVTLTQAEQPFQIIAETWYTAEITMRVASYGVRNGQQPLNYFRLRVGGPESTGAQAVFLSENYGIGAEAGFESGINAFWATLGYDTGRTSSLWDSWFELDQLICARGATLAAAAIAWPLPHVSIPTYMSAATTDTWGDVAGSSTGTLQATGGQQMRELVDAFTCAIFNDDLRTIEFHAQGGHADRAHNDGYRLTLAQESNAWAQLYEPSASSALGDPPANHDGARGDGSTYAHHGYDIDIYAAGKAWRPAIGAISGTNGNSSSAPWYHSEADQQNGRLGWTALNTLWAPAGFIDGVRCVESGSAYDPIARKVWYCKQNWANNDQPALVSIDVDSPYTVRAYKLTPSSGSGCVKKIFVHPTKRLLIMLGSNQLDVHRLFYVDLTAIPASTSTPVTVNDTTQQNRPTNISRGAGAVLSLASGGTQGALLVWPESGSSLYRCIIPAQPSSPWVWATLTNSGSAPVNNVTSAGCFGKMGILQMGDAHEYLFIVTSHTGAVRFLKLPKEGR